MMQDQSTWTDESDAETASVYYPMAGELVERTGVETDDDVLDIGCGTGTVAITAVRRGAEVTAVDITPAMLAAAKENAEIAGLTGIDWQNGDACDLPFADDAFDVTLSSLGHMYGDPPEQTTAELLRVTRDDGWIGFTSWTPTGLYPFLGSVLTTYLSPGDIPEFTEPPFAWGDSDTVENRLGEQVDQLTFSTETAVFPALSPADFWRQTTETAGPLAELVECVPGEKRQAMREEMIETIQPYFDERRNGVELEYLLTIAQR